VKLEIVLEINPEDNTGGVHISIYKLVQDWPLQDIVSLHSFSVGVHHPLIAPPPTCNAYRVAILLHDYCAIYPPPPTPLVYAVHHRILVMAISCKGQVQEGVIAFGVAPCEGSSLT